MPILEELLRAGMSVARFNFSHGSHEYHQVGAAAEQGGQNPSALVRACSKKLFVGLELGNDAVLDVELTVLESTDRP